MPAQGRLSIALALSCLLLCGPARAEETRAPVPGFLAQVEGAPAAPELRLETLDGPPADLSAGAEPGSRAVVVHFFATWCEPCRTELPALARFAVRRQDVRVLLVDVAEPEERIRRFFAGSAAPGPILVDRDRAAARRWGVSLLPATFVVAGARLHLAHEGEVDWDAAATDAAISAVAGPAGLTIKSQGGLSR
ncbi:TlpA disulfide reductase family protein [Xanthobacter sp. KR7-65]|uniref:TlpA family protein disulfide reductase n=1 Tax=Xanthobacter sp. KR7-65 TaxID=3156612 RepID=UPI0032B43205